MSNTVSEQRLVDNEKHFKALNDRVELALEQVLDPSDNIDFLCECSNKNCTEHIKLLPDEYQSIHSVAGQYFVKPNHETVSVERVVKKTENYSLVRKFDNT